MSTVLAAAVLTITTITGNIFGINSVSVQPTFFPTFKSCVEYVNTQKIKETDRTETTITDTPEKYAYHALVKATFSVTSIELECRPQG